MSALIRYVRHDWERTRRRLSEAWLDRPQPCFFCKVDLRCWRDESHCPSCSRPAYWNAGVLRDGRFHLALVIAVALAPALVLWLGLSVQKMWLAKKAPIIAFEGSIDPTPLLTIDTISFLTQFSLFGLAMLMSLSRVRTPAHALTRLFIVCVIGAIYWTLAPLAHQWL
jgi:hypothetical protein